jgi:Rhodopirellula transposase DDE domain
VDVVNHKDIQRRLRSLSVFLDERMRRLVAAAESEAIGLEISVCHFPPGTSKWNKIEHRLFSFISQNWRGKPLIMSSVCAGVLQPARDPYAGTTKGPA